MVQAVLRRPSKEVSRKGTARPLSLRQSMGVRYGRPRLLEIWLNLLFPEQYAYFKVSAPLTQAKLKSSTSCSKLDAPLAKKSPAVKKSVLRAPTATGKGQEPGSGGNVRSGRPGKPAPKNRLIVPKSKAIAIKKISASSAAKDGGCYDEDASPVYDSVEWSFREKLKKAEKKHKVSAGVLERRLGKSNTAPSPFVERAGGACGVRDAGGGGR